MEYLKSAVALFLKLNPISPMSGLSKNEILCILESQEMQSCQKSKFEVEKNSWVDAASKNDKIAMLLLRNTKKCYC